MMEKTLKREFPALSRRHGGRKMIYLDSACSALKMKSAADAQREFLLKFGGCAGKRSAHFLSRRAHEECERARERVAGFLNAGSSEIVFTSGTTESANILANSLEFPPGKNEVILSPLEHNSVFLPFLKLSKAGKIKLRIIPLRGLEPDFSAFEKMVSEKTSLVCLTRAGNMFGGRICVEKFIRAAHGKGAKVFVDEAQYVPTHREDLKKTSADFAAFSGHKMGAPFGTGVLFVKKDSYSALSPSVLGGGTIKSVSRDGNGFRVNFLEGNAAFEAGIRNYSGAFALARALEAWNEIGYDRIRKRVGGLAEYAFSKLGKYEEIKALGTAAKIKEGSIVSFVGRAPGFSCEDFNIFLNDHSPRRFIAVRTGRLCADLAVIFSGIESVIRISFHFYNTGRDIEIFCSALEKYIAEL